MFYKIRRLKSQIQKLGGIEDNQNFEHQKVVDILKSKIENLNLELQCKTYELEYIKSSRQIEQEINSLIISALVDSENDHELSRRLVELDEQFNNRISDLQDTFYTYNYSTRQN